MEKVNSIIIILVGVLSYANSDRYDGYWKNGKKDGKGNFHYANGDKYEGDFKEDVKCGNGISLLTSIGQLFYANGDKHEGEYKKDMKNGKGKFVCDS